MSDIDRDFASKDPIFALWRSIQQPYPLKLPASVMYAAAERGDLGELVWLDKWCEYDAAEALKYAASHLDIVHWLLCRPHTPFERIITVQFDDYPFRAISWSGGYIISYCVVADVGWLPPRIGVDGTYPLIDWAAEVGNLELLKKLHTHPTEKAFVHQVPWKTPQFVVMWQCSNGSSSIDFSTSTVSRSFSRRPLVTVIFTYSSGYVINSKESHPLLE